MRIAMLGTRGVPANYGGFETAVEEVGRRLVELGHDVTVYCRGKGPDEFLGMRRVELPALRRRSLETLSHTTVSVAHALRHRPDVALLFNAANAPLLPLLRLRRIPVAVHVDGLEWRRGKWAGAGRRYYMMAEALAVAWADDLIADCTAIADYYRWKFHADSTVLTYGAPLLESAATARVAELGLRAREFHLVVARMEPENNIDLIARGYLASGSRHPLVVVGGNPYPTRYTRDLTQLLATDPRVISLGAVYDQELLNALYAASLTYLHGHSVGGTNPSLLRAMGAGATVIATGNRFNREVLGDAGFYFTEPDELARHLEATERNPIIGDRYGLLARNRAAAKFDWDEVAIGYEKLCLRLAGRDPHWRPTLTSSLRRFTESGDLAPVTAPGPVPVSVPAAVQLQLPLQLPLPRPLSAPLSLPGSVPRRQALRLASRRHA
ncbi:glycosyl transferase [Frankia sp. R43]|nr:glycosyl transferase [Frankia sp. R43]